MGNVATGTSRAVESRSTGAMTSSAGVAPVGARSGAPDSSGEPILRVDDLAKHFPARGGATRRAVDGVSFDISVGETLGLIGESGCGKSTLARVITQLLRPTAGRVLFEGVDLTALDRRGLRRVRRRIQIIFQDPYAALNPRRSVGASVAEPLHNLGLAGRDDGLRRARQLLELVGLDPETVERYPHELSGGQRQRIGIARALACEPSLFVCDEPVSSLDVSIQAQIINLLKGLQQQLQLSYLFIAHDLAVVRHLCDRVAVMYLGRIVEIADSADLYDNPQHPYTQALLAAVPTVDLRAAGGRSAPLLEAEISSTDEIPSGCRFHPGCPIARTPGICDEKEPVLEEHGRTGHRAACHFVGEPVTISTPAAH